MKFFILSLLFASAFAAISHDGYAYYDHSGPGHLIKALAHHDDKSASSSVAVKAPHVEAKKYCLTKEQFKILMAQCDAKQPLDLSAVGIHVHHQSRSMPRPPP